MAVFMAIVSVVFVASTVGIAWLLWKVGPEMMDDWLGRILIVMMVLVAALCGLLGWWSGVESYDRFTITPEEVTVTVVGVSVPDTTYVTTTTMVGQTPIVQTYPVDTTSFSCREIEGRLSCSGHYHWKDGDKIRMRLYKRDGTIRTYDVLGAVR